jgi:hypothetical protein
MPPQGSNIKRCFRTTAFPGSLSPYADRLKYSPFYFSVRSTQHKCQKRMSTSHADSFLGQEVINYYLTDATLSVISFVRRDTCKPQLPPLVVTARGRLNFRASNRTTVIFPTFSRPRRAQIPLRLVRCADWFSF